jgi:hypothetical protein
MEALWLKQFSCIDRVKHTGLLEPPNKFFVDAVKKLLMLGLGAVNSWQTLT